jgi:hypothetical protein
VTREKQSRSTEAFTAQTSRELVIDRVLDVTGRFGLPWSRSKVRRLLVVWERRVMPLGRWDFPDFVIHKMQLTAEQARCERAAIEALRALLPYHDPTGLSASIRADRKRGNRA